MRAWHVYCPPNAMKKILGGVLLAAAVVAYAAGRSYLEERPKYRFEQVSMDAGH
jgi:hypothetical protein